MADVLLTVAQVEPIFPLQAEIYTQIAASAVAKGEVVYMTTAGTVAPADANDSGLEQARGIALNAAGAGGAVSVLKRGHVAGYTVAALNASAPLYLSNTVGDLSTTAGTMTVPCGIVVCLPDKDATKVFYADFRWGPDWT